MRLARARRSLAVSAKQYIFAHPLPSRRPAYSGAGKLDRPRSGLFEALFGGICARRRGSGDSGAVDDPAFLARRGRREGRLRHG